MKIVIWIQTRFTGYHRWVDAPDGVAFLRDYHRHIFHVKLGVGVTDTNREIEFFQLKKKVDTYLRNHYKDMDFEQSCEAIAGELLDAFDASFVEVSEDGENGATVYGE